MDSELSKRREPAQNFFKEGRYDDAVITGSQMLEALYRWLFKEVQPRMNPEEQRAVSKALETQGKSIGDLTMDQLTNLFDEVHLCDIAERELKRDFSFLKKPQIWRDLQNRANHLQGKPEDKPITEREAEAFLLTVDLYLHQAGLVIEEPLKRVEPVVRELSLRVQVPCQNMPEFVRGVLLPLSDRGAEIDVQVSLTARSQQGVESATLRKLKETLAQIGARILDEEQK